MNTVQPQPKSDIDQVEEEIAALNAAAARLEDEISTKKALAKAKRAQAALLDKTLSSLKGTAVEALKEVTENLK